MLFNNWQPIGVGADGGRCPGGFAAFGSWALAGGQRVLLVLMRNASAGCLVEKSTGWLEMSFPSGKASFG